jgi:cell wall-associated NlpC family hydrolase
MFVLDGAKARIAALTLAAATAVPLFPRAQADVTPTPPKAAAPAVVEPKAPKKVKKKKATAEEPKKDAKSKLLPRPVLAFGPKPVLPKIDPKLMKEKALKVVLATARKQLGKPYRYGASGPSSFDCSGFTMFVWRHVGVSLPHSSRGQYGSLPHVARTKARLGDLVYSPGHIGLYIGDGKMIHSPQTGEHVEVAPLHSNVVGFARPAY